jgi:predicted porin
MGALQQPASLRASNSVAYWLPDNIGGFYGTAMAAAGEGAANGMYRGLRLGWRNATVNVAAAVGRQNMAGGAEYEVFNTALSWDFGAVRLVGQYNNEELTTTPRQKEVRVLLGAIVPVASGELKASIVRSDLKGSANDATQVALGYVHHLSRRTALYTTVSRISNKGVAAFSVTGGAAPGGAGNASPGGPTPGGRSTGAELGIRHFF